MDNSPSFNYFEFIVCAKCTGGRISGGRSGDIGLERTKMDSEGSSRGARRGSGVV